MDAGIPEWNMIAFYLIAGCVLAFLVFKFGASLLVNTLDLQKDSVGYIAAATSPTYIAILVLLSASDFSIKAANFGSQLTILFNMIIFVVAIITIVKMTKKIRLAITELRYGKLNQKGK